MTKVFALVRGVVVGALSTVAFFAVMYILIWMVLGLHKPHPTHKELTYYEHTK